MRKPTEAQIQLIRYFTNGIKPNVRITRQTYARCEAEGWIVPIEEVFPYHEVTDAGREAAGLPVAVKPADDAVDAEFWYMSGQQDENGVPLQTRMWAYCQFFY